MNRYFEYLMTTVEINYVINHRINREDLKVLNDLFESKYPKTARLDILEFWANVEEYKELAKPHKSLKGDKRVKEQPITHHLNMPKCQRRLLKDE